MDGLGLGLRKPRRVSIKEKNNSPSPYLILIFIPKLGGGELGISVLSTHFEGKHQNE